MYYYCDIMKMKQVGKWRYVMVDLLLDLIVYADGSYDVLDIDEFANAIDKGELKRNRQVYALRILHEMIQLQKERRLIPPFIHKAEMYDTTIDGY